LFYRSRALMPSPHAHTDRISQSALRFLLGLGCPSVATSPHGLAQCNRPTAFTVPPLLAGHDRAYCPGLGPCPRPLIEIEPTALAPACAHSDCDPHTRTLLLPFLVTRVASGTEKRSRFHRPFFLPGAVARVGLSRNGQGTALASLRDTTRPCLRAPMGDAVMRLRLSLLGWSRGLAGHALGCPRATHPTR